jgi:hypothetical protein
MQQLLLPKKPLAFFANCDRLLPAEALHMQYAPEEEHMPLQKAVNNQNGDWEVLE